MKLSSDMRRSGVKRDVWTYASLIAACQSCGNRWQDALVFFQDMQDEGGPLCTALPLNLDRPSDWLPYNLMLATKTAWHCLREMPVG